MITGVDLLPQGTEFDIRVYNDVVNSQYKSTPRIKSAVQLLGGRKNRGYECRLTIPEHGNRSPGVV